MNNLTYVENNNSDIELSVNDYMRESLSANSRKAFADDMAHFHSWGGSIPCTPEMLCRYLSDHAGTLAIATLTRRLASLSKAHKLNGFISPTDHEAVRMTMRGIKRIHGKPQKQATPILKEDLIAMLNHCKDDARGKRDRALLLLGFSAALRRSEIANIKYWHIRFVQQGLILNVERSKTDQCGKGNKIGVPYARGRYCPVKAVREWTEELKPYGSLFRAINKGGTIAKLGMSDRGISNIVKTYVIKCGLDPALYSGHSLRAGLATSAAMLGVPSYKIRAQTGHKTDAMLSRYIRDGDMFTDNPAGIIL